MATPVPKIMAEPIPCGILSRMRDADEFENVSKRDETVWRTMPRLNMRFLPCISASLPKGTRNMADARR